jgi:hypothetical protein
MVVNLKERIVDWYLTRKTGKSKDQREYESWYRQNVNLRTNRIKDMLANFQYIVVVDPEKFFTFDPLTWAVTQDARQYFWPDCPIDKSAVWIFERVLNGPSTNWEWEVNELGGGDYIFFACQDPRDYTLFLLRWS